MRWRHLLPVTVEIGPTPAYPVADPLGEAVGEPVPEFTDDRSPMLVEALARLEVATRLRDTDAAARILERLADSTDGQWLLRQCVAAGLREVATHIAEGATPGDGLGEPVAVVTDPGSLRSVGPAA
jgi:hypothetical protein